MYLDHFHLKEKPFLLNTDPQFLWLGKKHRKALTILQSGVQENKGLLLLTGEIGSGKSMLISALISLLDRKTVVVAKLSDPGLERKEFLFLVAHSFGIGRKEVSRESFTEAMDSFLSTLYSQEKTALLIVDEAQIMTPSILEEIRLLSNMEYRHAKLLNIFLVGQNEFNLMLLEPNNRSLRERITTIYNLELLSATETATYISHRLKVAGTENKIFTDDALHEIHVFSNGSPRQINIMCDIALLHGFNKGVMKIDREIIRACKDRVRVPKVPGRPLADELVLDEAKWQTPDIWKYRPDSVTLLSKTVRRMSWYSAIAFLILLPSGYMLYSDWNRAFLSENIPSLKEVLPAPSLPLQRHTSSLAPSPRSNNPTGGKHQGQTPKPTGSPDAGDSNGDPAASVKNATKKLTGTSSNPNAPPDKRNDAADATRPKEEKQPRVSKTKPSATLPTKPKRDKKKGTRNQKEAVRVKVVTPSHRLTNPEAKPSVPSAVAQPRSVVEKNNVNRSSLDQSPAVSGSPQKGNQSDIEPPSSVSPDPSDVIKWLIREKDKSTPNKRP